MSEIDGAIHCEIIAGGGGRNKASFAYSPEVYLQLCCFTLSGFFSIFAEILPRRLRRIMQMSPGFFSVFSEFWPEILWDVWVTTRGTSGPSKFFQDSFKILSRFFQDSSKILSNPRWFLMIHDNSRRFLKILDAFWRFSQDSFNILQILSRFFQDSPKILPRLLTIQDDSWRFSMNFDISAKRGRLRQEGGVKQA